MTLRRRHWLGFALGAGLGGGACAAGAALLWRERALRGFGTTLWLLAGAADAATLERGLDAAVAAIRHVERLMSLFDPASAVSRLNRDGALRDPHPDLVRVLRLAQRVAEGSSGAFDVTVQPLWQLWQRATREGRMPSGAELREARARTGWRRLRVSAARIDFAAPGMAVTLNGIAQGFAADLARDALRAHGIGDALLDTGEWQMLGRSPERGTWQLGLADPRDARRMLATLAADGRGVACSSDDKLAFSADRVHHHILDPRSGDSPPHLSTVVVAAPSCALADALTKVMFMHPAREAPGLAARWGCDVLAIDKQGRPVASTGLAWKPAPAAATAILDDIPFTPHAPR
ncbi:MAG: FAD:protein FMN transferase [Burkholderiaceae bacterium]